MKKLNVVFVCLMMLLVSLSVGCTFNYKSLPKAPTVLSGLNTTATYDVLGSATGTASGTFLLGFIPLDGSDKFATLGGGYSEYYSPVEQVAIYNAISTVPDADFLIAPKWEKKSTNYILFRQSTVTVTGKAIRINPTVK